MGAHRDDTNGYKSIEEEVLENIDKAAASAEEPAKQALAKAVTIQRIVIAGIAFSIIFAATMIYALIKVNDVADQNQQYLLEGCVSGNESRASELSFWLAIFAESAKDPANQTKQAIATRKIYLDKVYKTYPQVDCSKVKQGERIELPPKVAPK